MSEHAWFHEQLPLYLTAGLDAASVERLQVHAAECAECGHELASMESLDRTLLDVFADIRPDTALESKLIDGLRAIEASPTIPSGAVGRPRESVKPQPKKRRWLRVLGIAASILALLAMGGLGAVLSELLDEENGSGLAQNNLRQIGLALRDDSRSMDENKESPSRLMNGRSYHGQNFTTRWNESATFLETDINPAVTHINPAATEFDTDFKYNVDRLGGVSVPGVIDPNLEKEYRGVAVTVKEDHTGSLNTGARVDQLAEALKRRIDPNDLYNIVASPSSAGTTGWNAPGLSNGTVPPLPPVSLGGDTYRESKDVKSLNVGAGVNGNSGLVGQISVNERLDGLADKTPKSNEYFDRPNGKASDKTYVPSSEVSLSTQQLRESDVKSRGTKTPAYARHAVTVFDEFFAQKPEKKTEQKSDQKPDQKPEALEPAMPRLPKEGKTEPAVDTAFQGESKQKGATEVKGPTGDATRRVVIRSGDIEFEVDSFDDAAAIVTRLTNAIKGGFVATTNSRKRENGKMEGTVVVRVPPGELDGLVEALRKALAKVGELKGQNIGSQDVTKQYVDTESTLRAKRTTEERLLRVIKEGKGEIKDLVIAEEKLGQVRSEIERMEGELRYYANLAALSTLSVKLTEKDIQVAAKLIENAIVKASIEVEDVEKAKQEIQKAIAELKGRVVKSESKQQSTGEFNVALEFETPAEATDAMRDRLRKLGTAAMLDTEVAQHTEGGGTTPKDVKPEKGPTTFKVALVNLGQLQARDVLRLALAVRDVIESHRKLRDAVIEAKGAVRHSSVDEKDRQNVTARLEFDVAVAETKRINELLAGLGERLSVATERRPEGERATEQRTSFKVDLSPASRIEPRETHALGIEVRDVEATLESLDGQVKGAGGRITVPSQRNQESNGRVTAVVVYDVPLAESEKMLKRIKSVGQVRVQRAKHNPTAPDGPLALARFELTLSNQEILVPREQGAAAQIRQGVSLGLRALLVSLGWLIVAVLFVGPWVLLIYGILRLVRRMRRPATPPA